MRLAGAGLAAVLLAMAAACAVPPTPPPGGGERVAPVMGRPSRTAEPAPGGSVVRSPLSLEQVLHLAATRSLDLALAAARREEAAAIHETASRSFWPRLRVELGGSRYDGRIQSTEGIFETVHKQQYLGYGGLTLEFRPGEAVYATQASAAREESAALAEAAMRLRVRYDAATAWLNLRRALAGRRIAEESLRHAGALEDWTWSRLAAGAALEADAGRARAARAAAASELATARARVLQASLALGRILRLAGPHPLPVAEEGPEPAVPDAAPEHLERLVALAWERRPDLQAADAEVRAAGRELAGTRLGWLLPSARLEVTGGGLGGSPLGLEDRETWSGVLYWELGFDQFARTDRAAARMRRRGIEATLLREAVRAEVGEALAALAAAREAGTAATEEETAARQALALAEARYHQGAALLVEVLDARQALTAAEQRRTASALDLLQAALALQLATGDGTVVAPSGGQERP